LLLLNPKFQKEIEFLEVNQMLNRWRHHCMLKKVAELKIKVISVDVASQWTVWHCFKGISNDLTGYSEGRGGGGE